MTEKSQQTTPAADAKSEAAKDNDADSQSTARPQHAEKRSIFSGLFPFLRSRQTSSIREDLTDALSDDEGGNQAFSAEERAMLNNILRLREVRVEDVMIPRSDIEAIDITLPLGKLLELFEESGHSRMPVYVESLDDARGMVHIRDVMNYLTRVSRTSDAADNTGTKEQIREHDLSRIDLSRPIGELNVVRKVLFVPSSMLATDLMARMKAQRIQMALVIDEYGGTDGLVSLEDIVEMVVGDIEDEHDDEEILVTKLSDGVFLVDARAELDDVAALIGSDFSYEEHGDDVDTIGGLVFSVLGRIPATGEVVEAAPNYEFHILESDPRRIRKVRIVRRKEGGRDVLRPQTIEAGEM
ncbi:MAG: hemolysin family protein [Phyllobacterium sp.]